LCPAKLILISFSYLLQFLPGKCFISACAPDISLCDPHNLPAPQLRHSPCRRDCNRSRALGPCHTRHSGPSGHIHFCDSEYLCSFRLALLYSTVSNCIQARIFSEILSGCLVVSSGGLNLGTKEAEIKVLFMYRDLSTPLSSAPMPMNTLEL